MAGAATALAAENHLVIGEYTTTTGAVVPIEAHPPVDDDAGHQANWLRKHHQVQTARCHSPVFCDRDWLSALAYAYTAADPDLLERRSYWAHVSGRLRFLGQDNVREWASERAGHTNSVLR
ncbi:hypothetical protein [Actinoalloteichus sp. GBA129-24]|uniref:hypothetical protein n=1 Tax=Actinoalloteichus sp. GBA129-24 TaxID=1612551 RepID=UPI000953474E|nr:hypothetical protein [Actinoalloteichus sp. GBA129-24]